MSPHLWKRLSPLNHLAGNRLLALLDVYQFQVLTDLSQHSATKFNRRYFGQILFDGLMVVAVAYKNWLGKYRIIA